MKMMRLGEKLKSRLFVGYVLSYFLVFLIPLLILGGIMYNNSVTNLQKEVEASNMGKLMQVRDLIEREFKGLGQTAAQIAFNPKLTPYMVRNDVYASKEAIFELNKYKMSFADEVFLYFHNDPVIYSPEGVNSLTTLTQYYYKYAKWNGQQFIKDINAVTAPTIRPAEQVDIGVKSVKRYLTYMVPIPGSGAAYGTVLFLIDEAKLTDMAQNLLGAMQGEVYIADENDQILASKSNAAETIAPDKVRPLLQQYHEPGLYTVKEGGQKYSLVQVKSDINGWSFRMLVPTDQFMGSVIEKQTVVIIVLLSLFMLGLGSAIVLSVNHYRPIRKLVGDINQKWATSFPSPFSSARKRGPSEIDLIRDTLDTAFDRNQHLLQQLDSQRPLIREQLLTGLLRGKFANRDEYCGQPVYHELRMTRAHFCVVLLSPGAGSGSAETTAVSRIGEAADLLKEFSFAGGSGFGVELIHNESIALIMNVDDAANAPEMIRTFATELLASLQKQFGLQPVIGIGGLYGDLLHINRSYIESAAALEYKLKTGANSIIFFEEVMPFQEQLSWYPVGEQVRFVQSLKEGDQTLAIETLKVMLKTISGNTTSIFIIKCMCYDVINIVLKLVSQTKMRDPLQLIKPLHQFDSLEQLELRLISIVEQLCEHVQMEKQAEENAINKEILDYIHAHFQNYDLSLNKLAERFQLSPSSMSRLFKELAGMNFTDYLTKLRMEEVKRELQQTDKAIREIISGVGYEDMSQFVRKFKKLEGLTPGQYRSQYQ